MTPLRLLTPTLVFALFVCAVARAQPPRTPAPNHALVVTRPGFQMAPDGSSRIFVLASAMPTYETRVVGHRVEIRVRGARLGVSNDRAWLDTRYFETPVSRARLERRGTDAILVCELRGNATPQVTTAAVPAGIVLAVQFPPGRYRTDEERRSVGPDVGTPVATVSPSAPAAPVVTPPPPPPPRAAAPPSSAPPQPARNVPSDSAPIPVTSTTSPLDHERPPPIRR